MKISLDWLKEYVDFDLPFPELVDRLNMIGLMVDHWEEKDGDIIMDVETYANRPDTLGHLGVARELSASLGVPLKTPAWPLTELEQKTSDVADVQVWDEDLCARYCGIVVRDVRVAESPEWLKKRVEAMGLKPINNVVDATNYVLFATAQPIHAFDFDKLSGRTIIVRRARKAERLKTLEGEEIGFTPEMLVIADEMRPVALAGIIGGEESSVTEATRDVFIESAYFDPVSVRKTRKALGIDTDASYRFERGADISFAPKAAVMAASLLVQFGGKVTQGVVDVYPRPRKNKEVVLRHRRIFELLGVEVGEDFVAPTLEGLGFSVESRQGGAWLVKVPFFRVDVEREADLVEEIARFFGYDKIPSVITPLKAIEPTSRKRERVNKLRQVFLHYGFDEAVNMSFSDPEREQRLDSGLKFIEIRNPISSKASLLRTTLIGGLLDTIVWNMNRGVEGVHVFEVGNIYFQDKDTCVEQLSLSAASSGLLGQASWQSSDRHDRESDFFYLKGVAEAVMSYLRFEPYAFELKKHPFYEEGHSLVLKYKGRNIGYLGLLKRAILDVFSLKQPVFALELNLHTLFDKQPRAFQYDPLIKFPSVSRDLSFVVDRNVSYQEIQEEIAQVQIPHLEEFELIDIFSGPSIPKEKVSLSLRFTYRHPQSTLVAHEVDALQKKIISRLKEAFGIQLREGVKIDNRTGKN